MNRRIVALLAVLTLAGITGCRKKQEDRQYTPGGAVAGMHKTPEEVFEASKAAMKDLNFAALVGCMAPETVAEGVVALAGDCVDVQRKLSAPKPGKVSKEEQAMLAAAAKHGLTEQELKEAAKVKPGAPKEEKAKAMQALVAKIDDKPAFLVAVLGTMAEDARKGMQEEGKTSTLKDVKVDGDTATGTIVTKKGGTPQDVPVSFKNIDGSWKLVMYQRR